MPSTPRCPPLPRLLLHPLPSKPCQVSLFPALRGGVSRTTGARPLGRLPRASMTNPAEMAFTHERAVERVVYDSNTAPHYHLYHAASGRLVDVSADELKLVGMPARSGRR